MPKKRKIRNGKGSAEVCRWPFISALIKQIKVKKNKNVALIHKKKKKKAMLASTKGQPLALTTEQQSRTMKTADVEEQENQDVKWSKKCKRI